MDRLFSPWRSQYIASFAKEDSNRNCVFCDAHHGADDEASLIVHRGREAFVIMNRFPYNSGHLMVLPVRHTSDFPSLTNSEHEEMMKLLGISQRALTELMNPHGFNIGMNLGRTAGAGIDQHLHWHIVPRWSGDTNFMPLLAHTKVISQDMAAQWKQLREMFGRK